MMADDVTDRLRLPLLLAGQAQKEVTHNEALARLDIATCAAVARADLTVPPMGPVAGQCWIVAAGASGAWAGHDGDIAGWTAGGWRFVTPVTGMEVWVIDRGQTLRWTGSGWSGGAAIAGPSGGSVVDVESRAAIGAMLAMLRLHGLIAST